MSVATSPRVLEVMRLMHGGARLRVLPHGTAMLDTGHIAPGVRRATVAAMADAGLIERDASGDRWVLTDNGRDAVRVRDHVADFIRGA